MKKTFFILGMVSLLIYFSSCSKCFTCMNECTQCVSYDSVLTTLSDTVNNVIRTYDTLLIYTNNNLICTDDATNLTREDYVNAIDYAITNGATCAAHSPTYTYDFCISKSGEEKYPDYFDRGGRAPCVRK